MQGSLVYFLPFFFLDFFFLLLLGEDEALPVCDDETDSSSVLTYGLVLGGNSNSNAKRLPRSMSISDCPNILLEGGWSGAIAPRDRPSFEGWRFLRARVGMILATVLDLKTMIGGQCSDSVLSLSPPAARRQFLSDCAFY